MMTTAEELYRIAMDELRVDPIPPEPEKVSGSKTGTATETTDEFNLSNPRAAFEFIEEERRRLGMSLTQMEARAGVSVNSVYSWRKCERSPAVENLVKIAEAFGYEVIMRREV